MNKHIILFLAFAFSVFFTSAQLCTPYWPAGQGPGLMPDSATGLPDAVINMAYSATIQYKVPLDTVYLGFPVTVNYVEITSVSGLSTIPSSVPFAYTTNPVNGQIHGDSVGCARVTGTATTAGVYPITLHLTVHLVGGIQIPTTYNGYRIRVDSTAGAGVPSLKPNAFDVSQNYPNPFSGETEIAYNTPNPSDVTFKVMNMLGTVVYEHPFRSKAGFNTLSFDASSLAPGLYFYSFSDGVHAITRRMIVDAK